MIAVINEQSLHLLKNNFFGCNLWHIICVYSYVFNFALRGRKMGTELLKASFIALGVLLFVAFNLATSKNFRSRLLTMTDIFKYKSTANIKKNT